MFEVFSLRLAAGLVASLWVLPKGVVEPRFYRIHVIIALCLIAAAGVLAMSIEREVFWLVLGATGGAALLCAWAWSVAELASLRLPTMLLVVFGALAALSAESTKPIASAAWCVERGADMASALLLGSVLTAMLLGHWYLIAPNLTTQPLLRMHKLVFAGLAARSLTVGLGIAITNGGSVSSFDRLSWLWLTVRVGAGLFGAAVLAKMSWEAAKIRATQSATGILYVVVIFVFIGELTDQLLMEHMGTRAA